MKVYVDALAKSEIFGGKVGEDETPPGTGTVVLVHPFGEMTMEADQIYALPRVTLNDHRIGDCAPSDNAFAALTKLTSSLHCTDFLSFTSVINVIASASEDGSDTLKSTDATTIQKNLKKSIGVELATMRKKSLSYQRSNPIRLGDCLDFCTVVDSTEVCSFCHHGGKEDLDQRITVLPPILVFLLKRFSYNAGSSRGSHIAGYRSKITDFVEFPLEGLDLSGYSINSLDSVPAVYDLICVCNHSGTADYGHYYAYCREMVGDVWKWVEYNDEFVREMRESEVQTENAYLLFYRRHDLMKKLGSEGVTAMDARVLQEAEDLEIAKREQAMEERQASIALSIDLSIKQAEEGEFVIVI